jgi:hypothetical protein
MMAWPNLSALQAIDLVHIGALHPVEVLYQFEQPCIFTADLPSGSQVLAYLVEELEQEERYRYLLATTAVETIADLKAGALSVREALLRGSFWLADLGMSDLLPKQVFSISVKQLPADALPDLDLLSFILRNPSTSVDGIPFLLDDDRFLDDAKEAYYQELPVKIAGRSLDEKNWTVVDLEFAQIQQSSAMPKDKA